MEGRLIETGWGRKLPIDVVDPTGPTGNEENLGRNIEEEFLAPVDDEASEAEGPIVAGRRREAAPIDSGGRSDVEEPIVTGVAGGGGGGRGGGQTEVEIDA